MRAFIVTISLQEIKKCYAVKEEMDRAVMATGARQTPERSAKCEAAKKRHKEFFDRVSTEVYVLITILRYYSVIRSGNW